MARKLIVDGQIFQTPAWSRGMGKYSMELVAQLSRTAGKGQWGSIELILSRHLPTPDGLHAALQGKAVEITKLDLRPNEPDTTPVVEHNRQVIDTHVSATGSAADTDYLILSLLQGEIYPVFPALPAVKKLLLFYDLIPLMFYNTYLVNPDARSKYLDKFPELLKADMYLAISKTAANDLAVLLGIDHARIVSIDGGPIKHAAAAAKKLDVPKPFILMPTGNDLRKNNQRGIEGFARFNRERGGEYHLVVTSSFDENEVARLSALADNVVFTGDVTGEELDYLYAEAEGLLFPSEYEGLGLPILEAVEKNKPVACSYIPVFREISEQAFHYFDPYSAFSIAGALADMIDRPRADQSVYANIIDTYTWPKTADKLSDTAAVTVVGTPKRKSKKIAVFGAHPSVAPAGENILVGHSELGRIAEPEYYLDAEIMKPSARMNFLPYVSKAVDLRPGLDFAVRDYGAVCHVIDNGAPSAAALFAALAVPGIAVLYDLRLEDTWTEMVERNLIDPSRLELEKQLDKDYGIKGSKLAVSLLAKQRAVLVFSEKDKTAAEAVITKVGSTAKVSVISRPESLPVYNGQIRAAHDKKKSYRLFAESIMKAAESL